jgi:hypothetical protein
MRRIAAVFALVCVGFGCASGSNGEDGPAAPLDVDAATADGAADDASLPDSGAPEVDPPPVVPPGEICGNGFDDNGNGDIDEGCNCFSGAKQSCYPGPPKYMGVGACVAGTQTCTLSGEWGKWGPCVGAVLPAATDTCEGSIDENCNGSVDEGCDCKNGATKKCGSAVGTCKEGSQTCMSGKWSACEGDVPPGTETCDGTLDEDCDGVVDEGCDCTDGATKSCGIGVGECKLGSQTCIAGHWDACVGATTPSKELCDGSLDEDCDGVVDDGCECTNGAVKSCGSSIGACKPGGQTCVDGKWAACIGGVGPVSETCNGIDDDCDGVADPGCECIDGSSRPCGSSVGACRTGLQTCGGGHWGACVGAVGPAAEICGNGVDENCNGVADEGCVVTIPVSISGDCVTVSCPPSTPYPVGCSLTFSGGDDRGCVANAPGSSTVYLKEGNECDAGKVTGSLTCSNTPGGGLNATNCKINKKKPYYPTSKSGCP